MQTIGMQKEFAFHIMGHDGSTGAVHCRLHRGPHVEAPRDARDFQGQSEGTIQHAV
jgi:hypothetical protein